MKKIFFKINAINLLLIGIVGLIGCSKKIDDAYANPNADVRVPIETLLAPIISCLGANGAGHGPYNDYRTLGKYIQNWQFCNAGDLYDRMSGRSIPLGSTAADQTASIFRMHYYDIGQNCMRMIQWGSEEQKWDYVGIGKAIFAWSWLTLTDVQGDVILDEAFDQSKMTFKYQSQEEVYTYVRKLAHEAIDYLSRTGGAMNPQTLAQSDAYMYGGDLNKWKKFAYAVLARSYSHLTNKSTFSADSVIKYCDLAMNVNEDNAMLKFQWQVGGVGGTANFMGPIRSNLTSVVNGSNYAIRQGSYIANLLTGENKAFGGITDPRAIYLLRKNANGTFKGVVPNKGQAGLVANDRPESFWGISQTAALSNAVPSNDANCRFIFRNTAPLPIITAAEIKFMKAEAAFKANKKDIAFQAYKDGVRLHFDMLTTTYNVNIPAGEELTPALRDAYINNVNVTPATENDLTITQIMLQKYIALFGIGVTEVWTDMRRYKYNETIDAATGLSVYRDFAPPTGSDLWPENNGKFVQRVYPRYNSETVWNVAELTRIGADKTDYHVKDQWFSQP